MSRTAVTPRVWGFVCKAGHWTRIGGIDAVVDAEPVCESCGSTDVVIQEAASAPPPKTETSP